MYYQDLDFRSLRSQTTWPGGCANQRVLENIDTKITNSRSTQIHLSTKKKMAESLVITPLELHEASAEKTALARAITVQAAAPAALSHSGASVSISACLCAAVRISNVHDSPVTFKVQTTYKKFITVSPQTGTMKPKSTIIVAVAYWNANGKDSKSSQELSLLPFQLCSWNPEKSMGSKTKIRFSLEFDTLAESGERSFGNSEGLHHRRSGGGSEKYSQKKTSLNPAILEHDDGMRGWPPFEKEKHMRELMACASSKPSSLQTASTSTSTPLSARRDASVTRLQTNATNVASKCKSISLQLGLFGCLIYAYVFSYPDMTGTTADVMAFKTAVLPAFLLGVIAEKIRRRWL